MENKAHALAAGVFVTLIGLLLLAMAAWLTRDTGIRHTYEISTREIITGLQEQAPVRFRGVDVGKVGAIGFDPKVRGNVLIRILVDRDTPLSTGTFATLSHQGVTGLAFIQLDDDGKSNVVLKPDDANPPRIPLRPGLLARLEERGEVLLTRAEEVTTRVNTLLGDANQKKFTEALDNFGQAADSASQLAKRLDTTVAKQLDPALAEATRTMRGVQKSVDAVGKTAEAVGKTAEEFGQTARRINAPDGPMDRLAEGSESLSHAAEGFSNSTLPRLNRVTEDASRAVRILGRTMSNINENPQALIYGPGPARPGPGEPGFQPPGAAR
jgi:phospholipid/cholesterol/gamma-HCH transport system substrate-binding protein